MRINTKSRYAISAMFELLIQNKPVKLADISESNAISLSYLEQIFALLRSKGLVKGQRGPGGGYVLGKHPSEISIAEIIAAVDEWVEYNFNKPRNYQASMQNQSAYFLWDELSLNIYDYLSGISLSDIVDSHNFVLEAA